jgi:RNA polymerase sigma factor (sigma-70 family)
VNRPRSQAIGPIGPTGPIDRIEGIGGECVARDLEDRFDAFVVAQRQRAVGLAWRLLGDDYAAAEDVAQDAFVRAFRGLARFRGEASESTWFYRILVNEVRRHRRWLAVRRRLGGLPGDRGDELDTQANPQPETSQT